MRMAPRVKGSAATTRAKRRPTIVASRRGIPPSGPEIRLLFRKAIAMGPGKAELLRLIELTGSISAAARAMDMSYRRAWMLVDTMNQCFRKPLVEATTGGQRGGGAQVTTFGNEVLRRYIAMEKRAARSVRTDLAAFRQLLAAKPRT